MRAHVTRAALVCLGAASLFQLTPNTAEACGGFFCSRTPVDQGAERVVFTVHEDSTDMVVQITYAGDDDDFAWLVPLVDVPEPESLDTVPAAALVALDTNTEPQFDYDPECYPFYGFTDLASALGGSGGAPESAADDDVTVFYEVEVGDYVAVALTSDDPAATTEWLRDNGYNIAASMDPYIKLYTEEGMKFLALKLQADATTDDIVPFKLTLPGTSPGIPLRLTTIAAEPEMSVKTWIFGGQRYEPANATEVEIDSADLRWKPNTWPLQTNYGALVAKAVNAEMGRGWTVDMAGDASELRSMVENTFVNSPEQEEAQAALLAMMGDTKYMTRLYTRLSAEEMTYDPTFRRSDKGDVAQRRQLPYIEELCDYDYTTPPPIPLPCDFAMCGAMGICREVMDSDGETPVAACGCAPGFAARTVAGPDGSAPSISCLDERLSFMNPGDKPGKDGERLPDTCVGFDCGEHGSCVTINLTPSCECEEGYVARPYLNDEGLRRAECVLPQKRIPATFYDLRPEERPAELPVGVEIEVPERESEMTNMEIMEMVDAMESGEAGPGDDGEVSGGKGCSTQGNRTGGLLALWVVAALLLLRRRARA